MVDVSVILVFHNEGWSTLMRTVHSVINMSPPEMLAEVVMIDDHSSKGFLHKSSLKKSYLFDSYCNILKVRGRTHKLLLMRN